MNHDTDDLSGLPVDPRIAIASCHVTAEKLAEQSRKLVEQNRHVLQGGGNYGDTGYTTIRVKCSVFQPFSRQAFDGFEVVPKGGVYTVVGFDE